MEVRTRIGQGGRIVVPAEMRQALGLGLGDEIVLVLDDDGMHLLSPRDAIRRAQMLVRQHVKPGRSLVKELLLERRTEARHE